MADGELFRWPCVVEGANGWLVVNKEQVAFGELRIPLHTITSIRESPPTAPKPKLQIDAHKFTFNPLATSALNPLQARDHARDVIRKAHLAATQRAQQETNSQMAAKVLQKSEASKHATAPTPTIAPPTTPGTTVTPATPSTAASTPQLDTSVSTSGTDVNSQLSFKKRIFKENPHLMEVWKDLVPKGVLSEEEFWEAIAATITSTPAKDFAQETGVLSGFLTNVRGDASDNSQISYRLTKEMIKSIFTIYPVLAKKYAEQVPAERTEQEFWTWVVSSQQFLRRISDSKDDKLAPILREAVQQESESVTKLVERDPLTDISLNETLEEEEEIQGSRQRATEQLKARKHLLKTLNLESTRIVQTLTPSDPAAPQSDSETARASRLRQAVELDDLKPQEQLSFVDLAVEVCFQKPPCRHLVAKNVFSSFDLVRDTPVLLLRSAREKRITKPLFRANCASIHRPLSTRRPARQCRFALVSTSAVERSRAPMLLLSCTSNTCTPQISSEMGRSRPNNFQKSSTSTTPSCR
eukprot:m.404834 g.404834  ORF g.404834 m.404834 type:complete len:526 (-) comp56480_c0_seq26:550-2127(-)